MVNDALFSSDKNFWETPQKLFDELDAEFHFTLDAAASDENHKCARYFTQSDDGLRQNWEGETVQEDAWLDLRSRKCRKCGIIHCQIRDEELVLAEYYEEKPEKER